MQRSLECVVVCPSNNSNCNSKCSLLKEKEKYGKSFESNRLTITEASDPDVLTRVALFQLKSMLHLQLVWLMDTSHLLQFFIFIYGHKFES